MHQPALSLFPHDQHGPRRWWVALLCLLFLSLGLLGHDPWKVEDATHLGVAWSMWQDRSWLTPSLAGNHWPTAPLPYWLAAASAALSNGLLPAHEATRLTTFLAAALCCLTLYFAAARLYGQRLALGAPLLLAGSLGLLVHSHETQPVVWLLLCQALAFLAIGQLPQRPGAASALYGTALGLAFLAEGLPGLAIILPLLGAALLSHDHRRAALPGLPVMLLLAGAIAGAWLLLLQRYQPQALTLWWSDSLDQFRPQRFLAHAQQLLGMLPWFAWPSLPIAAWGLWLYRRRWRELPYLLPSLGLLAAFLVISFYHEPRSAKALPLLVPLALLGAAGLGGLRRGAAHAFDWFAMVTFTIVGGLIWLGWVAMVFGLPAQVARNFAKLEPGFQASLNPVAAAFSLLATLAWLALIYTTPRSIYRGALHWLAGLTLIWLLTTQLWMPWIDYGKTYRPLAQQLAERLQDKPSCVINGGLSDALRASFDYFIGLRTVVEDTANARSCRWLLTQGSARADELDPGSGWRKAWEGNRPGDRSEKIRLYRRGD